MPELRQQVFTIKLVVINIMFQRCSRFMVFKQTKKIIPVLFLQLDLNIIVYPEIQSEHIIYLPAKLVILHWRHDPKQAGIFKKAIGNILCV